MNMIKIALVFLISAACSHDTFYMKIESNLSSYGSAIRWGLFQKANEFLAEKQELDLKSLKKFHVTSYDPVYRHEFDDRETIEQTVEIRYYLETNGVEKVLIDHQVWHFDEKKSSWFLATGLPKFE